MTTIAINHWFSMQPGKANSLLRRCLATFCLISASAGPVHAGFEPPTPDQFLVAPGDRQVELKWLSAPRATHYTIKAGSQVAGPFSITATGVTANAWIHTNLVNGRAYHYVISASNEYGESDNSTTLTATPSAAVLDWLPAGAKVEKLAGGFMFVEGPVWSEEEGGFLVFSDINANRLIRWSPRGGATTFRFPSNRANGNTRDAEGRLISCEQTGRRVTRTEHDGTVTTLVSMYNNATFNAPNDVVVKSDGTIWFTDPNYGGSDTQPGRYVYRFHPDDVAGTLMLVASGFGQPNGLCFSPDESLLYVADSGGSGQVRAFDVLPDNTLSAGRVFTVVSPGAPDGIRTDAEGRLFSSAGDGVQIFGTNGVLQGRILTSEAPANVGFGGSSNQMIFMPARTSLYGITRMPDLVVTGVRRFPTNPRRGQSVAFTATVKNQGTAPTPAGQPLRLAISISGETNVVWSDNFTESLAPDASVVLTFNEGLNGPVWTGISGSQTLFALVDNADQIDESGEANNLFMTTFSVAAAPDTDGDGHDDSMENAAGTDPLDPNSVLRFIASGRDGANSITLTWASVSNRTYRIACKGSLLELVWNDLTGPIRATSGTTTWSTNLPPNIGEVFFKVRTP